MNPALKKNVLDSRQLIGLLLLLSSLIALIMILCYQPPDQSLTGITNQMQTDNDMVQQYGFLLPPTYALLRPVLGVIVFLALLNFWLGVRKKSAHQQSTTPPL